MIISKGLETFLDYIRELEQLCRISASNEQEANDATQDILHSLELEEHDYRGNAQLAKKLKEVRRARREAKDTAAQASPLVEWAEANSRAIKELERVLGAMRREEKNATGRFYTPKTTVLSEKGKEAGNAAHTRQT